MKNYYKSLTVINIRKTGSLKQITSHSYDWGSLISHFHAFRLLEILSRYVVFDGNNCKNIQIW